MTEDDRRELALAMVSGLPAWGQWATGFRDFETPWGKVGFRQLAILWALRYELISADEFTPRRIADLHDVQPSVITRALAKLETGRFIERVKSPVDGRSYRVVMTEQGRKLSEYVEQLYVDDIVNSAAFPSDAELDLMRACVEKLGHIVDELERKRRRRITRSVPLEDGEERCEEA